MISIPDEASLMPQVHDMTSGNRLYVLPSNTTELVRLDLLTEAGAAYQPSMLVASSAARLYTTASLHRSAEDVAEWLDYRGVVVENHPDLLCSNTTVYALRKYCSDLIPLLSELRREPAFPEDEFEIHRAKTKQKLQAATQRSGDVARNIFYEMLFGTQHPLGCYAVPADADRLSLDEVRSFYQQWYIDAGSPIVVASGNVDEELLEVVSKHFGEPSAQNTPRIDFKGAGLAAPELRRIVKIPGAVQTTLRMGRLLPMPWNSMEYARFMLLTTVLGGYFGSRLMSNLREDKGFTYGAYARTQIYRGAIVFYITAEVAAGTADAAEEEVRNELHRLCIEPVSDDELQMVKTVLAGDFIRSVDGVFERAERLCSMLQTDVDEMFTANLRKAINETTAGQLQELAQRLLSDSQMTVCQVGA